MIKGGEFCPDLCATPAGSHRGRVFLSQPLAPPASGVFLLERQKQFALLTRSFLYLRKLCNVVFFKTENLIILIFQSSLAVSLKRKEKKSLSFSVPPFNTLSHCIKGQVTVVSLLSPVPYWIDLEAGFRLTSIHYSPQSKAKPTLTCKTNQKMKMHSCCIYKCTSYSIIYGNASRRTAKEGTTDSKFASDPQISVFSL